VDGSRFDDLARSAASSRRGLVKALFGSAIAGALAVVGGGDVAAKKPYKKPFHRLHKTCNDDADCGQYTFCNFSACPSCSTGVCWPTACRIGGAIYQKNDSEPGNPCQICNPDRDWNDWSDQQDGIPCGNPTGDPCVSAFSACQAGVCVPTPVSDGTECGTGQVCCGGDCCPGGLVCGAGGCQPPEEDDDDGSNPPCPGGNCDQGGGCTGPDCPVDCTINGVTYPAGTINPDSECEWCDTNVSTTMWSARPANERCGIDRTRFCCNGICCVPGKMCCGEVGTCQSSCGA
jgi:hypothetical protein